MRLLFISDIHGITDNLKYIDNVIKEQNIDKIVCLGDLYYAGPTYGKEHNIDSSSVLDFLTSYSDKLICMKGNCDSLVDVKASDFPICDGISLIHVDDLDIYITHGNEYSYDKNRKINRSGVLVYGHEHIPSINKDDNMTYICVGSISLPRGGFPPTYAIYDNKIITIYDINSTIIDKVKL